jgi:serine/threonine protein kinase
MMKILRYQSFGPAGGYQLKPGDSLQLNVKRRIGGGGMSTVYRETDEKDRTVAIKISQTKQIDGYELKPFFENEARVLNALHQPQPYPNIIQCFGMGETQQGYFLTLEAVDAKSLTHAIMVSAIVRMRAFYSLDEALMVMEKTAQALHHVHGLGFIHGDVKPGNILYRDKNIIKLVDFAMAREEGKRLGVGGRHLLVGTKVFLSPERLAGHAPTIPGDIFSLGVTFYMLFYGNNIHPKWEVPAGIARLIKEMTAESEQSRIQSCSIVLERIMELKRELL